LSSISRERLAELYPVVRLVLDEALSLGPRARALTPGSRLLGEIPELDSQAVVHVLVGLEEQFGISFEDDIDADAFATLESLTTLVAKKTSVK
jgi:acyl carrier protein